MNWSFLVCLLYPWQAGQVGQRGIDAIEAAPFAPPSPARKPSPAEWVACDKLRRRGWRGRADFAGQEALLSEAIASPIRRPYLKDPSENGIPGDDVTRRRS